MGRSGDSEIKSMGAVAKAIESLDDAARDRVVAWINAKWGKRADVPAADFKAVSDDRFSRNAGVEFHQSGKNHVKDLPTVGGTMLGTEQKRG